MFLVGGKFSFTCWLRRSPLTPVLEGLSQCRVPEPSLQPLKGAHSHLHRGYTGRGPPDFHWLGSVTWPHPLGRLGTLDSRGPGLMGSEQSPPEMPAPSPFQPLYWQKRKKGSSRLPGTRGVICFHRFQSISRNTARGVRLHKPRTFACSQGSKWKTPDWDWTFKEAR